MSHDYNSSKSTVEAEVLESSVIDEGVFKKVLLKAGRAIALPALEALEMILDSGTPPKVRLTMLAALTYLIMPLDLVPDFVPIAGFSDDFVALTAVVSLWSSYITPKIKMRARQKLDSWLPL